MPDPYKNAIRNTIKQIRSKLSFDYRSAASQHVCSQLRSLEQYRHAKHIGLYHAVHGEVDLTSIWSSSPLQGKFCYFPALKDDLTLSFLPATPNTSFKNNLYGIPEPDVGHDLALPPEQLDIILIPLVAFDYRCTRLGMGSGYYDRTLNKSTKPLLIGIGYHFQFMDFIVREPWDVPLDAVITQNTVQWSQPFNDFPS